MWYSTTSTSSSNTCWGGGGVDIALPISPRVFPHLEGCPHSLVTILLQVYYPHVVVLYCVYDNIFSHLLFHAIKSLY